MKEPYPTWTVKLNTLKQQHKTAKAEEAKKRYISCSLAETHLQTTASDNHNVIYHARNMERQETIFKDKSDVLKYAMLSFH